MRTIFTVMVMAITLSLGLSVNNAMAQDSFVVNDIRVQGLQRITPGTVFNYLPVKIGDNFDKNVSVNAIRELYKTGFFKNVSIKQDDNDLIVIVDENPSIDSIAFTGNKAFADEILKQVLQDGGLREGEIYKPSVLELVVKQLKAQYLNIGKYSAQAEIDVKTLDRNRVALSLNVREGKTAKIKKIAIIGNEFFSDKAILSKFKSRTGKGLNPFSKANLYSKDKVTGDIETLRSLYQNAGFVDFEIVSSRVSISPEKDGIYLTLNVNEGKRFRVSQFTLNGRLIVEEAQLLPLVSIKPGGYYSRADVDETVKTLSERMADEGYADARIVPVPEFDRDNATVSFAININPNRVVYVRRIEIVGNAKTNDEVVRRELRQLEGAPFSPSQVQRSKVRLQRLSFFETVDIKTQPVPDSPDQVDLTVEVLERPTGNFLFGVGYSGDDGVIVQAEITQANFLGTGKSFEFGIDTTGSADSVRFNFTDPYLTTSGVQRTISFRGQRLDSSEADTSDFLTETLGVNLSYRFPISEYSTFSIGGGLERVDLISTDSTPPEIGPFIEEHPENNQISINSRLAYDTRDSLLYTTSGWYNKVDVELATPGSDLEYYKASASSAYYLPLTERSAFKLGANIAYGDGYGDIDGLPFFKNYYAGGNSTVRGYRARSLGPRDSSEDSDPLGGSKRVLFNATLLLPFPGIDTQSQRIGLFVDAGQVYASDQSIDLSELRFSAGIGLNWLTPVGPLSLSYGVPLNDEEGDDIDRVQFSIGRLLR
ncbi:MAG: outer membrane protein assembly factor BamA [Arenicella sp.]